MTRWVLCLAVAMAAVGCNEKETQDAQSQPDPVEEIDLVEMGLSLHSAYGCVRCHSLDGTQVAGPSYLGIHGQPVALLDGTTVIRDEAYLRRSIVSAKSQVVQGYIASMGSYPHIPDIELDALVALIVSLGNNETSPIESTQ